VTHLIFLAPHHISGTAEARVVRFCVQIGFTGVSLWMINYPLIVAEVIRQAASD